MPRISIYEHSDTYSYQTRNLSYATVALPICAIWGPAYDSSDEDNNPDWLYFPSGYRGTTDFVNTFKGPNVSMGSREKSYDYALKLLSIGYDVLVKRADNLGAKATTTLYTRSGAEFITAEARYPGSYGNQLKVRVTVIKVMVNDVATYPYGYVEVYDRNGQVDSPAAVVETDRLLESYTVAFDVDYIADDRPYIDELVTPYIGRFHLNTAAPRTEDAFTKSLEGGNDLGALPVGTAADVAIRPLLIERFGSEGGSATSTLTFVQYMNDQMGNSTATPDPIAPKASADRLKQMYNQQKVANNVLKMIEELTDPLTYDWDCLFLATMDDQYIPEYWKSDNQILVTQYGVPKTCEVAGKVAAQSKCGAVFFGTPFGMAKGSIVEGAPTAGSVLAYKKQLSEKLGQYATYAELVFPWTKSTLPTIGANTWICPELAHLTLIITGAGINGTNRWWMVPAGMNNATNVHSPEYKVKKHYLDLVQDHDKGINANPLMEVPGKGFTCFGNSTLWNKPLNTYNALQNLSTRLLANRVEQRIWDVSLLILFKYNNQDAYAHFYAGLSPLLDEMRAAGALTPNASNPWGYRIVMNPDIIDLDHINANTAIGKVYLAVTGVIDDVQVDLFLLPPNGFDVGLA